MSIMELGDFTVWNDPETMTTTVSVDGRTEQVTQTAGEMLEILGRYTTRMQDENTKLLKLVSELLVALLRSGCDIEASWDRLRKLLYIGLTESECLTCDKACKVEAENAELRKLLLDVWNDAIRFDGFWDYVMDDGEIYSENELPHYQERMRELGIEMN